MSREELPVVTEQEPNSGTAESTECPVAGAAIPDATPSPSGSTTNSAEASSVATPICEPNTSTDEGTEPEEPIPAREVDFLLTNAETNRVNDMEALKDEYEDKLRYIAEERDDILKQKMDLQVKHAGVVNEKVKLKTQCDFHQEDARKWMKAHWNMTVELKRVNRLLDEERGKVKALRGSTGDSNGHACVQPCSCRNSYGDEIEETPDEPTEAPWVQEDAEVLEQYEIENFGLLQDLEESLENNGLLCTEIETCKQDLCNRIAQIDSLEKDKIGLEEKLGILEKDHQHAKEKADQGEQTVVNLTKLLLKAEKRESDLKSQLSAGCAKWKSAKKKLEESMSVCQAKLLSKDSLINALRQQSAAYLNSFKETIRLVKNQVGGDELALKLADFLTDTLDRNEVLEMEVWKLRTDEADA